MAGQYRPEGTYWTAISDHRSAYVDEIADPWVEVELGLRVHDELLAIAHYDSGDALMQLLIHHDPSVCAPEDLCSCVGGGGS